MTGIINDMHAPAAASIIVPTYREATNIRPLVERIFAALRETGREVELILIDDDSRDGTEAAVDALRKRYPVRLVIRHRRRSLAGAVLDGFNVAKFDRFVVLDADLQHPPEMIPALLDRLDEGDCDFVMATRFGHNATVSRRWPWRRRLLSRLATWLARPLAPLSDPMSGFFALHRRTWQRAAFLNPIGYKIALELFVKAKCTHPAEVPIAFAARSAGTSKMRMVEQVRFLKHLVSLYQFRFPWLTRMIFLTLMVGAAAVFLWTTRLFG